MKEPQSELIKLENQTVISELSSSKPKSEFYISRLYAHEVQHIITTIQQYYYEIEHPGVNSKNILKYIQGQVLPIVNNIYGAMFIITKEPVIYPVTEEIDCAGYTLARIMSTIDGRPYLMIEQSYVQPEYRTGRFFLELSKELSLYGGRFMVEYIQCDTRSKKIAKMLERLGFKPLHMTYIYKGSTNNFTAKHPIFKQSEVNTWAVDQVRLQEIP